MNENAHFLCFSISSLFSMSQSLKSQFCQVKEIAPLYRLFNEYKNEELMYTVTFLILLMYLEEFFFAFRKRRKLSSIIRSFELFRISSSSFELCSTINHSNILIELSLIVMKNNERYIYVHVSSSDDDDESIGGLKDFVSLSCNVNKYIEKKSKSNCRSARFSQ